MAAQVSTTRCFKLSNLASDLTTNASRPVRSLLTGKDSCLTEMSLDRNAREYRALRESLISIMITVTDNLLLK